MKYTPKRNFQIVTKDGEEIKKKGLKAGQAVDLTKAEAEKVKKHPTWGAFQEGKAETAKK